MSRKLPIRTYQRKNIPKPLIKIYDSTQTDLTSKFDYITKKQDGIDNIKENKISEDSLDCDPFETTFDRIAKDAVVPPIPLDCMDDKSWYDSSFDTSNEKEKQNESLFHVSIGTPTTIISPEIKYVNSYVKMSYGNNTKKKKRKPYNAKTTSKSKHAKELTLKEENHVQINKKKRKLCKVKKKKENNILNNSVNIVSQVPMNDLTFKENLICSTPIITYKKKSVCSILCSPINTASSMKCIADNTNENVVDSKALFTLHTHLMNDINASVNQPQPTDLHVLDPISTIDSTNGELCVKDNSLYEGETLNHSLSSKRDTVDVQEQKILHLETSGNSVNFINNRERYDTIFMDDSIDLILKQNHNKAHQQNNPLLNVLNTYVETDRSRSLFNDSESKLHSLTSDDNMSIDKSLTNMDAQKSNADNKLKLELSALNIYNNEEIRKSKIPQQNDSCKLITIMKNESVEKSSKKGNEDIEDKCYSEVCANPNQSDINDPNALFTEIQDSAQVTKRRARDRKKKFYLSDIHENENDFAQYPTSKISQHNKKVNNHNQNQNLTKNLANTPTNTVTHLDNKNVWVNRHTSYSPEKCIFLKPGKFWARSLSILHNFQNGLNLNEMSVEKGKRWRYSVQNILDMQKKDLSSSCREVDKHIDKLQLCNETQIKSCTELAKEYNTDQSALSKRFTRRISVRVVRDSKCIQNSDDISFLEVYGICTNTNSESTTLETSCTTKCNTQYRDNGNSYSEICSSKTAREVVLQRCSQQNYLPFRECVPDAYLKYCQKIGEGVYGEVFLYKKDLQKSVLKIIPIEGDQLVNGEPQKKFNEILSEIVIAKELHNLRFSKIHSTSGFVEVKSIKCIEGKYPEEMINLWKNYDNEKRSDNDCPSIFDENQLYITFELGHGGQDLEAFEFYTAFEAHSLFIQAALTLAVAEKSFEFEHRDLHWGNVLISHTDEQYIYYKLDNKDIFVPSNGVKVCIIDFTLSRMLYQGCCIFNDLSLDPVLFTAQGEYQFEIYRLMRDKIQNNWQRYEPYTNILWLHYILDKMATIVRYKKKNLKKHKNAISMLNNLKDVILSYQSAFDFVTNCDQITSLVQNIST